MNAKDRLARTREFLDQEIGILETKGREYTAGAETDNDKDTLVNFKQVGEMVSCKCENCGHVQPIGAKAAWAVYFLKHVFSVMTHVGDPDREMSEPLIGRLLDIRVYAALLDCLDAEDREKKAAEAFGEHMRNTPEEASTSEVDFANEVIEHRIARTGKDA